LVIALNYNLDAATISIKKDIYHFISYFFVDCRHRSKLYSLWYFLFGPSCRHGNFTSSVF